MDSVKGNFKDLQSMTNFDSIIVILYIKIRELVIIVAHFYTMCKLGFPFPYQGLCRNRFV